MVRYFINLDRSADRRKHIEEIFQTLGLSVNRVPAVDGRKLSAETLKNLRPDLKERHFWLKEMTPGEIGAYLSHLKTWRLFLETDEEWALIMEDDSLFRENAREFICDSSWIPEGIGLIQLTSKEIPGIDICEKDIKSLDEKKARLLKVVEWSNLGALGYLINRQTAEHLILLSDKVLGPVDDVLFLYASPLRQKVEAWGLSPAVIYYDDDLASDVGLEKKNNRTPKFANFSGYLERKILMFNHKVKCLFKVRDHR